MTRDDSLPEESVEDLFENAPCGYLSCGIDGTIVKVNHTFESWTGYERGQLVGRRLRDLLTAAGRIYYETHYRPLLALQGAVREIALDIVRADGTRLPALINSSQHTDQGGRPRFVRTTIIDATDRRSYEQELLHSQRREHDIALQLQRSLLSGELAASSSLTVDVVYQPAEAGLEVGGDWYDAFWLARDETVGLVVGDVVGKGIEAAATMGQLRSALRGLAWTGLAPVPLLDALDGYAAHHAVGLMTTVAYVELDVLTGDLRYACAGHPPPLLINPGEAPEFLWDGRSTPLAAVADNALRANGIAQLKTAGTLLLFTDGLVERRGQAVDVGLERLVSEAAQPDAETLRAMLERIMLAMDDDHSDDRCLLGARRAHRQAPASR